MERIFRAQKMLDRVRKEGKEDLLDEEMIIFIKSLDGKVGNDYNYNSFVYGQDVVWIPHVGDENSNGTYVALCDCD